jgi:hypothetical protein
VRSSAEFLDTTRIPVCVEHDNWNGVENELGARLRNIQVRPDLAKKFVAGKTGKVAVQNVALCRTSVKLDSR